MILNTHASYPQTRIYVVKLHADADPQAGRLIGRLEHVASGRQFPFSSADELLACLAQVACQTESGLES